MILFFRVTWQNKFIDFLFRELRSVPITGAVIKFRTWSVNLATATLDVKHNTGRWSLLAVERGLENPTDEREEEEEEASQSVWSKIS